LERDDETTNAGVLRAGAGEAKPGAAPAAAGALPGGPDLDLEIIREFVQEGNEQLAEADTRLLALERNPAQKDAINAVFRSFHTIKGLAGFLNLDDLQTAAHAAEDLLDHARSDARGLRGTALELVFQASDVLKQLIRQVGDCLDACQWPPAGLARVPTLVENIRKLLDGSRTPELTKPSDLPLPALDEPEADPADQARGGDGTEHTIRVDAQRLDQLVDLVSDLVITERMVNRVADHGVDESRASFRDRLRLSKITRELQQLAGSLRMVTVQGLFSKMARLARDTARKCNKAIVFEMVGADTELDKSIVEKVADPLVHLIRNAIDHGLEAAATDRTKGGKPSAGRIELRAFHKGGSIFIEVEDDGRGLNRDAIVAKAIQRGLLHPDAAPEDRAIFSFICEPGFSTAAKVTSLSGRGVGLDVVKRNINAMGGSLDIRSEGGRGTCFAMKLPLTLAVIDGMLVRAGKERYVIPTLSVLRVIELRAGDVGSHLEANDLLELDGQPLPLLRLTTLFHMPRGTGECRVAIVAEAGGQRIALLVDELLGRQQALIKGLGQGIGETPGVAGCAILSDGRVGLVLDVAGLLELAQAGPGGDTPGRTVPKRPDHPGEVLTA
jgi:two-component system chemotaxis sensor kinase CheA